MVARRLERPLDPDAPVGRPVRFRWEGREIEGREGEPLAVALLAAGHATLSRSFRFHRPRGLMCASGTCGWCECAVDGLPSARSCRLPLRAGLDARGEHAWPCVERDLFGLLDLVNPLITPSFYHHRFLRPRSLRKRYLDVIRAFGGRGRVSPGNRRPSSRPLRAVRADVAVVGAGRGGLAAAIAAADHGARVVVVDAANEPGGHAASSADPDERAAVRDLARRAAAHPGVQLLTGATAVSRDEDRLLALADAAMLAIGSPVVVAATGSHERPPLVRGGDLPGVVAAREVEALAVRWGVAAGRRAVLVGDGPEMESLSGLVARTGGTVVATVPSGHLRAIHGRGRVEGVSLGAPGTEEVASREVRAEGIGTEEVGDEEVATVTRLSADLVAFTERVPSLELALLAGAELAWTGGRLAPLLGDDGATSIPWLFVAGSAAGWVRDDDPGARAERAGTSAARAALGGSAIELAGATTGRPRPASPGVMPAAAVADAHVCYCEDVRVRDILREAAHGYREPEMLKRRTGALTGPCQGKLCLDRFMAACAVARALDGAGTTVPTETPLPPTGRPPLAPVRLADLVVAEEGP